MIMILTKLLFQWQVDKLDLKERNIVLGKGCNPNLPFETWGLMLLNNQPLKHKNYVYIFYRSEAVKITIRLMITKKKITFNKHRVPAV